MMLLAERITDVPNTTAVVEEEVVTPFAVQLGLLQEVVPSTGVYPFTLKTTYSSGSEATDN